jgi:hypothetical protein
LSPYGSTLLAALEGAALASSSEADKIAASIESNLLVTFGHESSAWQTSYRQRGVAYDEQIKQVH